MNDKQAIQILNHMLDLDRRAITRVMNMRTTINGHLAEFPDVQIHYSTEFEANQVGPLGIINAFFGPVKGGKYDKLGKIFIIRDDEGLIERFVHHTEVDNYEVENSPGQVQR